MVDKDSNCIVIESDSDDDVEFVAETKTNSVIGAVITPVKLSKLQTPYFQNVSQVRDLFSNVQIQAQPDITPVLIQRPLNESTTTEFARKDVHITPQFVQRASVSPGNVIVPNNLVVKVKKRNVCRKSTSRGQVIKQKSLLKPSLSGSLNTIESSRINPWDGPKIGVAFSLGTTVRPDATSSSSPDLSLSHSSSFDLNSTAFVEQNSNECKPISSVNILKCSESVVTPQLVYKTGEISDAANNSTSSTSIYTLKPESSSIHTLKPESSSINTLKSESSSIHTLKAEISTSKSTSFTSKTNLVELLQKPRSNTNVKLIAKPGQEKKVKKGKAKEKLRSDAALVLFELKRLLPGGEASFWSLGECLQTANTFIPNLCSTDHLLKIKYLKQVDQNICKTYEIDRLLCELREMCTKQEKECEEVNHENLESNLSVEVSKKDQSEPSTSHDTKSYQSDYYKTDQIAFSFHNYWDKLHQYDAFLSHLDACVKGDKPNTILDIAESNYRAYSEQFSTNPEPLLEEIDLKEKLESLKIKLENKCHLMEEEESDYSLQVKIFDSKDEEDLNLYEDKGELEEFKTSAVNAEAGNTNDSEHIKLVISSFRTLETFNFDSEDENNGEQGLPSEECTTSLAPGCEELINEANSTTNAGLDSNPQTKTVNSGILPLDLSSKEKIKQDFQNYVNCKQTKVLGADSEIPVDHNLEKKNSGINYTLQGLDIKSNENSGVKNLQKEEASSILGGVKNDKDEEKMKCKPTGCSDRRIDISPVEKPIVDSTEVDLSSNCRSGIKTIDAIGNNHLTCLQSVNITDKSDEKLPTTSTQKDHDGSIISDKGNKKTQQDKQTKVKSGKNTPSMRRSVRLIKTETNHEANSPVKEHSSNGNEIDDDCKENKASSIMQLLEDKSSDINKTAMTSSTNINVDSFPSRKKATKVSEINTKSPNFKHESSPKKPIENSNHQNVNQPQKKRKTTDTTSKPAMKKIVMENCSNSNCNKNISNKKTEAVSSKKVQAIKNIHPKSEEKIKKNINKQIVIDKTDLPDKRTAPEEGKDKATEEDTSEVRQVKIRKNQPSKHLLDKKLTEDSSKESDDKVLRPKKKYSQLHLTKLKVEHALKTLRFKKISKSPQPGQGDKKSGIQANDSQNENVSQQRPAQVKNIPKGVLKTSNKTQLDGTRYASQGASSHEKQELHTDKEKVPVKHSTTNKGVALRRTPNSESSESPKDPQERNETRLQSKSSFNTNESISQHNSKRDSQKVYTDQNTSGRRIEERSKSYWPNHSLQERKDWTSSEKRRDSTNQSEWRNRDPRKRGLLDTPPRKASRYSSEGCDSELPRQRTTQPRLIDELIRSRQSEDYQQKETRNYEFRPNKIDHTRSRNHRNETRWQENYPDTSIQNSPEGYRYESDRNEYQPNRSLGTNWDDYGENRLSEISQYESYRYSEGRQNYQSNRSGAMEWDGQRPQDRYQTNAQNLNHDWRYTEEGNGNNSWQSYQSNRDGSMLSRVRQNMNR